MDRHADYFFPNFQLLLCCSFYHFYSYTKVVVLLYYLWLSLLFLLAGLVALQSANLLALVEGWGSSPVERSIRANNEGHWLLWLLWML